MCVGLLIVASIGGCKRGDDASATSDAASGASPTGTTATEPRKRLDHPGTEDGMKALLTSSFASSTAKPEEVVAALRPDSADYAAVFEGDAAQKVETNTNSMLAKLPTELGKDGDAVKAHAVTTDQLKSGDEAAQSCPGGYARIASHLKPGITLYCTKVGSISYDVFAHVNGHWVWFPKAFRALRE
jgi:hypothetical protein